MDACLKTRSNAKYSYNQNVNSGSQKIMLYAMICPKCRHEQIENYWHVDILCKPEDDPEYS